MKNMKNSVLFLVFTLLLFGVTQAAWVPGSQVEPAKTNRSLAAGCLPAASFTFLDINNVRTRINTGGDMWWDLAGTPVYEIPKESRKHSMFSASLWIGGVDVNGQLKLAALRYRQIGNDYWPGPLTTDGAASITPETCIQWDRHFIIKKQDVIEFLAWRENPQMFPNYKIPRSITHYPAHGDISKRQARFLAPFFDADGDGEYNYEAGDYPYYDLSNKLCPAFLPAGTPRQITMGSDPAFGTPTEKGGILVDQVLKGDQTLWWVFNDKGNVHTETGGTPIGLEIRAQAFAFTTNDEINNATFYSYEIINRSTHRLTETYFSQWVDADIGYAWDDYVGCDVLRGLGYAYNGVAVDGSGRFDHYGAQPPAIGVDFFQGPYMDPDGMDNPKYNFIFDPGTGDTLKVQICDESINGVNFGNGIVDDERFGMRRFVYHNNTGVPPPQTDPRYAAEYYNFLRGIWKDGTRMLYGGNAHISSGAYGPEADFMFPGDSDPCDWGTGGIPPNGPRYWTEETAGNLPHDRRFMQSAGPFTLEPGAVNYITVGIPWARASAGGPFQSVELLRLVSDKTQRLFDNCFKVVDGPTAPNLTVRELDREIIIYLSNPPTSNNYKLGYVEFDPSIVSPDTLPVDQRYDSLYRFEGYQIFQVVDASVTGNDIHDPNKARLVAQADVQNGITRLINFYYNESLGALVPREEVNGTDQGIVNSFRILEDRFATGDRRLVNNKKYYFLAIAYAHNEFMRYEPDPQNQIPGVATFFGQQRPYLAGRLNIKVTTAIPHISSPLSGGTIINAQYGAGPKITRIEGHGNAGRVLELTEETISQIMSSPNHRVDYPTFKNNFGPLDIKVIDPLNVKGADYLVRFDVVGNAIDSARWTLIELDNNGNHLKSWPSDQTISVGYEQLFPELGLSVNISQVTRPGPKEDGTGNLAMDHPTNGLITSSITFADSTKRWLTGVPDIDGTTPFNWIKSGTTFDRQNTQNNDYDHSEGFLRWIDQQQHYEKIVGGTWAPYRLTSNIAEHGPAHPQNIQLNRMENLYSVDIVFTADKSKWTRAVVVETGSDPILSEGGAAKLTIRRSPSVDKDGNPDGTGNGMGWFPGYAINVETGERLNIMFGESSWLVGDNGRDMLFNPTSNFQSMNDYIFGGKHYVYVFAHNKTAIQDLSPGYDEGAWVRGKLTEGTPLATRQVFQSIMWVGKPMAARDVEWLSTDATVKIRVTRPFQQFSSSSPLIPAPQAINNNWPLFRFNTYDLETVTGDLTTAKNALSLINVVPNPYYSFSLYETTQLDNLVKITNLPKKCTVSIFTVNGTLIRQFTKDDSSTIIEWDLKNHAGVPISGGLYLFHINAPGIGERTVKWFGSLRPLDLNAF